MLGSVNVQDQSKSQACPLYEAYVLGSVNVQDQTTTPGTPCPTLHEWCVGSLTSHSYLQQGLWELLTFCLQSHLSAKAFFKTGFY